MMLLKVTQYLNPNDWVMFVEQLSARHATSAFYLGVARREVTVKV